MIATKPVVRSSVLQAGTRITCPNNHYICATKHTVISRNDRLPHITLHEYNPLQPPFRPELPDTLLCIACGQPWLVGGSDYGGGIGYYQMYQYRLRYWSLFAVQMYLISPAYPHIYPVAKIHTPKGWWP